MEIGQRFGKWTIIGETYKYKKNYKVSCLCDCGTIKEVFTCSLTSQKSISCGCFQKEKLAKRRFIDLTNRKIGRWVVLGRSTIINNKSIYWRCRCSCGEEKLVDGKALREGKSTSCGCFQREIASKLNKSESGLCGKEAALYMQRKRAKELSNGAIKRYLYNSNGLKAHQIKPEMIVAKRNQLLLHRKLKEVDKQINSN